MTNKTWTLLIGLMLGFTPAADIFGQNSWLGDLSSAIPRVNPAAPTAAGGVWSPNAIPSNGSLGMGTTGIRQDWRIGVVIENRDVGAVVTQVQPGSAAQQAGISAGDVIVGAGPNRIGFVDGRVVDLAEVARSFADNFGRISLVVLDNRTRQLRNVSVNMMSNATSLSGNLVLQDNGFLPADAVAIIELRNVTRPFFQVQGGQAMFNVSRQGPFAYSLNIDPRFLDPLDQYELRASISSRGQMLYSTQSTLLRSTDLNRRWDILLQPSNFSTATAGGVVSAAYPSFGSSNPNIVQELQSLLGRQPMANEITAWDSFLQSGNTLQSMRQRILANPQLRSNFGNDAMYVQHIFTNVMGRNPSQTELSFWLTRLRATNSPDVVINEMSRQ
ncbi:YbaY family lipoprotein [Pirellulaceae bacterium SH449]